jgi:2-haloacid dehalogenase
MQTAAPTPLVLLFDVNETLLDMAPLKQRVGDILLDPHAASLWFTTMLQYSLVMTVSEQYAPFGDIGAATLQMLARKYDMVLDPDDAKAALSLMRTLPPYPEVKPALERLKQKGLRLATLTNSPQAGVKAQMEHAGLAGLFERQLSVESVGKFKPHRSVYTWAAQEMGVAPEECMLVAAHGWDIAGAQWAGMQTAFIAREGQQKFPLASEPNIDVSDLTALGVHFCG